MLVLHVANIFLFVAHSVLILFNVFGWIWRRTRIWNLITLLLTAFSATVMGIWKGFGYCVCTDLHWQVRAAMGIHEESSSYLVLLIRNLTGWDPPVEILNPVALVIFLIALTASIILNLRDRIASTAPPREPVR